ncbi:LemA protein [Methanosarcina thermophila]|uniref:LemA protein n=1 Tax=Methanosarcina thermophila TaxID=2210 RepID=A0A1I6Z0Y3_METTE|nr:LemA family protein [Methanosarcina thermophila]SFT56375.1 LemA protein [Methanosarcina thermophila]BAW29725.1 LemA protein [Methanosarcina thermophila]GLI14722.1 LemA family protein [Methanosarcina thermophila MST-A1]HOA68701.1 LemA family protein [Methanosarcina thermophila]HOQ65187.1 LemA family protein [Methanosarcina thermophila]
MAEAVEPVKVYFNLTDGDFLLLEISIIILIILGLLFVIIYNDLIKQRNRVENAWAQIDVQLKRRYDLIPNLVETVKGYAKHEKTLLEDITKARAAVMSANSISETAEASNYLSSTLKSLFAVAENYPELKANQNFMQLQKDLMETENKIAYSRQFYNDTVMKYNISIQTIPKNIVASLMGFTKKDLFETQQAERETPKVKF